MSYIADTRRLRFLSGEALRSWFRGRQAQAGSGINDHGYVLFYRQVRRVAEVCEISSADYSLVGVVTARLDAAFSDSRCSSNFTGRT